MSKREAVTRYNLIIQKLRRKPSNFQEISDYLRRESEIHGYNYNISQRTFQRDLEDIRSIFNIEITFNRSLKCYAITADDQTQVQSRMFEAFDTFNALNLTERLSEFIHFENRKPLGTEHLHGLVHAISNKLEIHFLYQKYWDTIPNQRKAVPIALKEFKNRWYVIAYDHKDKTIKSFALDRLTELNIQPYKQEIPIHFDLKTHYNNCFGIISPNDYTLERIVLSFIPHQGKYIKSLPLHHTQEIIVDNENELRIALHLYPTEDFIMELLSYGDKLTVIEPTSLIGEMKEIAENMVRKYV